MTELQPIQTAPRDGTRLLLYRQSGDAHWIGYWDEHRDLWRLPGTNFSVTPTHWMPLPKPPEDPTP